MGVSWIRYEYKVLTMTLRELKINDRFIHASQKSKANPDRFKKVGYPEFNSQAGTATCRCVNETKKVMEDKQAKLQVLKLPL